MERRANGAEFEQHFPYKFVPLFFKCSFTLLVFAKIEKLIVHIIRAAYHFTDINPQFAAKCRSRRFYDTVDQFCWQILSKSFCHMPQELSFGVSDAIFLKSMFREALFALQFKCQNCTYENVTFQIEYFCGEDLTDHNDLILIDAVKEKGGNFALITPLKSLGSIRTSSEIFLKKYK